MLAACTHTRDEPRREKSFRVSIFEIKNGKKFASARALSFDTRHHETSRLKHSRLPHEF